MRKVTADMRRSLQGGLAGGVLAACCLLAGRSLATPVVVVKSGDLMPYDTVIQALDDELEHDIRMVTIDRNKRNLDLTVREIWDARPEVLVALGARALELCTNEFSNVPVVFGLVADPDQYIANPDLAAGITLIPSDAQFLKAIKMLIPDVRDVVLLYDHRDGVAHDLHFSRFDSRIGIRVHHIDLGDTPDPGTALMSLADRCQGMIIAPDPALFSRDVVRDLIIQSYEVNLPIAAYSSVFAEMGAFMAVEGNNDSVGNHLAKMARYLIEGGSNRDLGTRPPPYVTITVNKAVAEAFGIEVSPGMMHAVRLVGN
jgi:ABC-type uncharacterized transport system substrate-binding protein